MKNALTGPNIDSVRERLKDLLAGRSAPLSCDRERAIDLFLSKTVLAALNPDRSVDRWIKERLRQAKLRSELVPLSSIEQWEIDGETGNIGHVSGRFFTILGVKARHRRQRAELVWDQPMIDQPEIGILGILARKFGGILHFCLQAKEEPGNIHSVQLSPTVQATYSNYTQAHGGALPPFVRFFLDPAPDQVLYAKLQTEDGGRFLFKSNRNMVVLVDQDLQLPERFIWLTLRQIADLLKRDNTINACTRSILSGLL
jgi:oxidase EvaA